MTALRVSVDGVLGQGALVRHAAAGKRLRGRSRDFSALVGGSPSEISDTADCGSVLRRRIVRVAADDSQMAKIIVCDDRAVFRRAMFFEKSEAFASPKQRSPR